MDVHRGMGADVLVAIIERLVGEQGAPGTCAWTTAPSSSPGPFGAGVACRARTPSTSSQGPRWETLSSSPSTAGPETNCSTSRSSAPSSRLGSCRGLANRVQHLSTALFARGAHSDGVRHTTGVGASRPRHPRHHPGLRVASRGDVEVGSHRVDQRTGSRRGEHSGDRIRSRAGKSVLTAKEPYPQDR